MSGTVLGTEVTDWSPAQLVEWCASVRAGHSVTADQHNSATAAVAALSDVFCNVGMMVTTADPSAIAFPRDRATDRAGASRDVPVLGTMQAPSYWRGLPIESSTLGTIVGVRRVYALALLGLSMRLRSCVLVQDVGPTAPAAGFFDDPGPLPVLVWGDFALPIVPPGKGSEQYRYGESMQGAAELLVAALDARTRVCRYTALGLADAPTDREGDPLAAATLITWAQESEARAARAERRFGVAGAALGLVANLFRGF